MIQTKCILYKKVPGGHATSDYIFLQCHLRLKYNTASMIHTGPSIIFIHTHTYYIYIYTYMTLRSLSRFFPSPAFSFCEGLRKSSIKSARSFLSGQPTSQRQRILDALFFKTPGAHFLFNTRCTLPAIKSQSTTLRSLSRFFPSPTFSFVNGCASLLVPAPRF